MKKQTQIKAREIKKETVKKLAEKIGRAKTIIFCDYHGLTVNQINALRKKVREAGGEMLVAKNTLLKLALDHLSLITNSPREALEKRGHSSLLTGPTAIVLSYEDEIAPLKSLADSIKSLGGPKYKFGFSQNQLIDISAIENLAKVPPREVLQGKIVSALASPIYGIVQVLQLNIRNLLSILDQVSKSKS